MTAYYCLALVMLMPLILAMSSIPFRMKQLSKVDIQNPRAQATRLQGAGERVVHAQKNAWEATILFAVTLFLASENQVLSEVGTACLIFLGARIAHALAYVGGLGNCRFVAFLVSFGAILWILVKSLF